MNFKEIPIENRPREKLMNKGAKSLTNSELMAIIISTGNKKENVIELSDKFFNKYNLKSLSRLKLGSLKKQMGIGDAKACKIIACFELGRRLSSFSENKKIIIKNPKDVANLFMLDMGTLEKEYFKALYLDSKNQIIKQETLFIGSLNESIVHPRDIFKIALEENAASVVILHNHPSGDPNPSEQDLEITKRIIEAGKIIGIEVLDHIIIGENKYISLKQKGIFY